MFPPRVQSPVCGTARDRPARRTYIYKMRIITMITTVATTTPVIPPLLRGLTIRPLGRMSYLLLISMKLHTSPLPSPVDQQFTAVDRNLCNAFAVIETSRQNLYDCRATVTDLSKRCGTYEQSYKSLCPLYKKVVNDLHKMVNKNLSFQ
jgi:hypothetical protein